MLGLVRPGYLTPPRRAPRPAPTPRFAIPEEDFDIGIRAYEWPKKMVDIMKEATTKVGGKCGVRRGGACVSPA